MKLALAVLAVALALAEARFASINVNLAMTVSEDTHRLSEDMVRLCAQETDISMEELHKFRQHDFSNSTEATQCFAHCIYEQMGLMHDGVFLERDTIRTLADITDPKTLIVGKKCLGITGANKCETAFKIHQCRHELRLSELSKHDMDAAATGTPMPMQDDAPEPK